MKRFLVYPILSSRLIKRMALIGVSFQKSNAVDIEPARETAISNISIECITQTANAKTEFVPLRRSFRLVKYGQWVRRSNRFYIGARTWAQLRAVQHRVAPATSLFIKPTSLYFSWSNDNRYRCHSAPYLRAPRFRPSFGTYIASTQRNSWGITYARAREI